MKWYSLRLSPAHLASVLAATLGICILGRASSADAQTLRGVVLEDSTERPIADAAILLIAASGDTVGSAVRTAENGTFAIHAPRFGKYRVRAVRIGYQPVTSDPIDLENGELTTVRLIMSVAAARLASVAVTERRGYTVRELMSTVGFDLRRARPEGAFFTGEQLDRLGSVGDIARSGRVAGLRLMGNIANETLAFQVLGQSCTPAIYLDGDLLGGGAANALMQLDAVGVENLYGIEVYRGSNAPPIRLAGFLEGGRCGFIAAWSKMQVLRDSISGVTALRSGTATGIQVIRGVVADVDGETPVAGIRIRLLTDTRRPLSETAVTDSFGEFVIRTKRVGGVRLAAPDLGFQAATTPAFLVKAEELVRVRFFVSPRRAVIAPLGLVGRALPEDFGPQDPEGFVYRQGRGLGGVYFRAEDIERRQVTSLADLLSGLDGIAVGPGDTISIRSAADAAPCTPTYLIDGVRVRAGIADSTVRSLPLSRVLGVELYRRRSEVPLVFGDIGGTCGMIALWRKAE